MVLLSLAVVGGCASGGPTQGSPTLGTPAAIYTSPETGTLFTERPQAREMTVEAAPAAVWLAVKKVYADLDIPITIEDQAAHQIGNNNIVKTREMAGKAMTAWLDCGSGMTGDRALEYRIYASLLTDVLPDPKGGTTMRVTFSAVARDIQSGGGNRLACTSTGRLEQTMLDRVNAAIGRS